MLVRLTVLAACVASSLGRKATPLAPLARKAVFHIPSGGESGDDDAVAHPTSFQELKLLSEKDGVVVIDFSATWCGPCQKIAPVFSKLAADVPSALFVKVDVDEIQEASQHFGVSALPTFIVLKDGTELTRFSGANEPALRKALEDAGCPPPQNDIF